MTAPKPALWPDHRGEKDEDAASGADAGTGLSKACTRKLAFLSSAPARPVLQCATVHWSLGAAPPADRAVISWQTGNQYKIQILLCHLLDFAANYMYLEITFMH